jgi:branched-chain amino acid transport system ATP-binding protein
VLTVTGVSIDFGGLQALKDVHMTTRPREIVGVIGPNGAGKTTLLNVICGLNRADGGEIRLDGVAIHGKRPDEIAAMGLARTFQTSQLFAGMTVLENLMTGLHLRVRAGLLGAVVRTRAMREEEEEMAGRAWKALEFVGLERFAHVPGNGLSFGQQRVVEIARALMVDPKVVLLDEPAVGLSLNRVAELDRLLRRIRDERGVTLVVIEHVIRLVMGICDRVVVMNSGVTIAEGTPETVSRDPGVVEAYLGRGFDVERAAP